MSYKPQTTFPDEGYLHSLITHQAEKTNLLTPLEKIQMYSGARMDWIADYLTDRSLTWTLQDISVESLYLTGTNPHWNAVIIDQCGRSVQRLRELMHADPAVAALFSDAKADPLPILVRYEDEKYKVLDGMHRVVASIRDGVATIPAYVARRSGKPQTFCEPHVVYDLMKAYHRGLNPDRAGLVQALRFLRQSYRNVESLLRERFIKAWVPDDEIQTIIREALHD